MKLTNIPHLKESERTLQEWNIQYRNVAYMKWNIMKCTERSIQNANPVLIWLAECKKLEHLKITEKLQPIWLEICFNDSGQVVVSVWHEVPCYSVILFKSKWLIISCTEGDIYRWKNGQDYSCGWYIGRLILCDFSCNFNAVLYFEEMQIIEALLKCMYRKVCFKRERDAYPSQQYDCISRRKKIATCNALINLMT